MKNRFTQGSPEWLAYRIGKNNASEVASAAGIATADKPREQLMNERHTGEPEQVTNMQRRIFDDGHRFEALSRPLGERLIGEDLIPEVWSLGNMSASYDGVTIGGNITWEHKQWNQEFEAIFTDLYGYFRSTNWSMQELRICAFLPEKTRLQIAQQQLILSAEATLFTASKWSDNNELECIAHCWVMPDAELLQRVIDVWNRFEVDFAAYTPPAPKVLLVAQQLARLPALEVKVTGMVTASNLDAFKSQSYAVIDSIKTKLVSDQDFVDAADVIKWCAETEDRLDQAQKDALGQAVDVQAVFAAIAQIKADIRAKRLNLNTQVTANKAAIKTDLKAFASIDYKRFACTLPHYNLLRVELDCDGAIRSKSSIDSMQSALNALVASAKTEAEKMSARIGKALSIIDDSNHPALFSDRLTLCLRELDVVQMTVDGRVLRHQQELERVKNDAVKKAREQEFERDFPWAAVRLDGSNASAESSLSRLAAALGANTKSSSLSIGEISKALGISVSAELLQSLGCQIEVKAAKKIVTSSLAGVAMRLKDHIDASVASYVSR